MPARKTITAMKGVSSSHRAVAAKAVSDNAMGQTARKVVKKAKTLSKLQSLVHSKAAAGKIAALRIKEKAKVEALKAKEKAKADKLKAREQLLAEKVKAQEKARVAKVREQERAQKAAEKQAMKERREEEKAIEREKKEKQRAIAVVAKFEAQEKRKAEQEEERAAKAARLASEMEEQAAVDVDVTADEAMDAGKVVETAARADVVADESVDAVEEATLSADADQNSAAQAGIVVESKDEVIQEDVPSKSKTGAEKVEDVGMNEQVAEEETYPSVDTEAADDRTAARDAEATVETVEEEVVEDKKTQEENPSSPSDAVPATVHADLLEVDVSQGGKAEDQETAAADADAIGAEEPNAEAEDQEMEQDNAITEFQEEPATGTSAETALPTDCSEHQVCHAEAKEEEEDGASVAPEQQGEDDAKTVAHEEPVGRSNDVEHAAEAGAEHVDTQQLSTGCETALDAPCHESDGCEAIGGASDANEEEVEEDTAAAEQEQEGSAHAEIGDEAIEGR